MGLAADFPSKRRYWMLKGNKEGRVIKRNAIAE
jgi:hypothetical protein